MAQLQTLVSGSFSTQDTKKKTVLLQLCGGIIFDRVIVTQVMPSGKAMRFMKSSLIVITLALTLKTLQVSVKHMGPSGRILHHQIGLH